MGKAKTKKRVLVTGATGFVGSAFVERLLKEPNYSVRCLVRDTSRLGRLESVRDDIEWVQGDITRPETLPDALNDVWGVVNLAGYREFWSRKRSHFYNINQKGAEHVFKAACDAKVEKAVQVSTPLAFGVPKQLPFNERSTPANHPSHYGLSKCKGDAAAWRLHKQSDLPLSIVYLAAVIGAGDDKATMEVKRAIDGRLPALVGADTTYTYVYLGDAVEAIAQALLQEETVGERYLVGMERATTREYFNIIGKLADVPVPAFNIPEALLKPVSSMMEFSSRITGIRPMLPMDVLKTTASGSLLFDGTKAQKAFNLEYRSLEYALNESVQGLMGQPVGAASLVDKELMT